MLIRQVFLVKYFKKGGWGAMTWTGFVVESFHQPPECCWEYSGPLQICPGVNCLGRKDLLIWKHLVKFKEAIIKCKEMGLKGTSKMHVCSPCALRKAALLLLRSLGTYNTDKFKRRRQLCSPHPTPPASHASNYCHLLHN